ncbi:MAG: hypothetical protein WCS85_04260 [Candidatus Peribacteraceae bacterium]
MLESQPIPLSKRLQNFLAMVAQNYGPETSEDCETELHACAARGEGEPDDAALRTLLWKKNQRGQPSSAEVEANIEAARNTVFGGSRFVVQFERGTE